MLAVAAMLHADPSGYGTHEQLGLPPCSFLVHYQLPCPTCGLTTSVTAMAHGQVLAALASNPFGAVLFMAAVVLAAASLLQMLTGLAVLQRMRLGRWWLICAAAGVMSGWLAMLANHTLMGK